MQTESRLILSLGALLLIPAFWLPLWSIRIVAPQYNDGLGMFIGLRDIWGHTQHDIQNINILNHYIGMQQIDPAIVDVLTIMPWVVGFLIVSALIVALIGKRWLVMGWLVAFALLGTAGLYEFYSWNVDYGTNLDPRAPIKIPGMVYTPPIFGTKQLLNMTTTSLPSWGTLFIGLAFLSGVLALVNEYRPFVGKKSTGTVGRVGRRIRKSDSLFYGAATGMIALLALTLTAAGCTAPPATAEPQHTAAEFPAGVPCAYCAGIIEQARFGGQLTTIDGQTYRFMSVECLAGFIVEGRVPAGHVASVQVVDYSHGERLIDAETAHYVRMQFERSPNGLNLAAVETERVAGTLHYFHGGERMKWPKVLEFVRQEWGL
jgi:copper chaperone NosL